MGIFNRRNTTIEAPQSKPIIELTEQRSISDTLAEYEYSMPTSLGFASSKNSVKNVLSLSAAFAAVDMISGKIASIPIVVKTFDGQVVSHPFDNVFDTTLISKYMTIKQLVWDTLVSGNGFAYIKRNGNGVAQQLVYLPAGSVTIQYNQTSQQLFYLCPNVSNKKIEPVDMIHILKNSADGVNGKPVSFYGRKSFALAGAAENTALNFFDSGCAISGILKSSKPLSTQQKTDIKMAWNQSHVAGEPNGLAVLGNDLTYEQIGSNSSESQLLESRKYSVREIARYFGIPAELIGDDINTSYNSLSQAIDALITFTLQPFILILEDEFNRKCLLPSERHLYRIDFVEESLRMPDETAQAQALNSLVAGGIMTANEARKKLGLNPLENGDELRQPQSATETIETEI